MLDKFEDYLSSNLPASDSFHPHYEKSLQKMLLAGGKRFRPLLVLSVVQAYNPLLISSAMPVALAVEFLHTYSLIHDDLPAMDDAPLRRGHETLHTVYDEATAILAGDALNTESFNLIASAPLSSDIKIELVKELAHGGGVNGMVLGQAIDLEFENKPLKLDELKFLHIHKTARLIASSLKMGALIVSKPELADKIYNFGIDLGLLFQIQDDIIDETQTEEEAGKTTNNDSDKNSFVNLLTLDGAIKEANHLALDLEKRFDDFDECLKESLNPIMNKYLFRHKS
jgi:farnesyl diphosphate synthase